MIQKKHILIIFIANVFAQNMNRIKLEELNNKFENISQYGNDIISKYKDLSSSAQCSQNLDTIRSSIDSFKRRILDKQRESVCQDANAGFEQDVEPLEDLFSTIVIY